MSNKKEFKGGMFQGVPVYCCDEEARQQIDALAQSAGVPFFGRVWNLANSTPVADHYIGSLQFGQSLPERLGLGCYIVKNDHSRKKLMANNHYKYEDGTPAKLDGTEGHYQWGWGKKWYLVAKQWGNELTIMISLGKIPGEYNYEIPIASESAAGWATMERSTGKLVSYINNGTDYRGGNNDATRDAAYNTLLGRPASNMTTQAFLNAARANGDGWTGSTMRMNAAKAFLFYVIFGNLNVQADFNPNRDANGLYQGGLGVGATNAGGWWNTNFGYQPVIPMSAGIEQGDAVGNFSYNVLDGDGNLLQTMSCHNFFGLKNGMGGVMYRMMTDELLVNQEDKSQKHYIAKHLWKVNGSYEYSIAESITGFMEGGTLPAKESAAWDYITKVAVNLLQLTPTEVAGSSTTRFADGYYNPAQTSGFRLVLRSGDLGDGGRCGLACVSGSSGVSYAFVSYGSSLCETAEEWSVEPEYVEVN